MEFRKKRTPEPAVSYEILAHDFMELNAENKRLVETLIDKGVSPHIIGKMIWNKQIETGDKNG